MGKNFLKHGFRHRAVDGALLHHLNERCQMGRRKFHLFRIHLPLLKQTHGLHHQPVGRLLGLSADFYRLLKQIRHVLGAGEKPRVIGRKAEFLLVAGHFLCAQLRLAGLHRRNPLVAYNHRRKIRIREIAVILGVLLGAHGLGALLVVIPAPRLLDDLLSILQELNLPGTLPLNGPGNGLEGVQILHLCPGSQGIAPRLPHGQVHVRPHGALLELAVRSPQILDHEAELFQVGDDFLGAAHIRLGDNLNQGHAASVVIHQGAVLPLVVDQLSRVLLHVNLMDSHLLFRPGLRLNLHPAVVADGQV